MPVVPRDCTGYNSTWSTLRFSSTVVPMTFATPIMYSWIAFPILF